MNINLFLKYLGNTCSRKEVERVFSWVQTEEDTNDSELMLKSYWSSIKQKGNEDESVKAQRLNAIHHQINLNRFKRQAVTSKKKRFVHFIYRAAVILLLPILTLFVYTHYFEQNESSLALNEPILNEIFTLAGSRISLSLADGTKVWLNHGSSLVYPQQFVGQTRTVKLKGEGYFEVVKNPDRPFVVETELMNVVATGTAFNVQAYEMDNVFTATLKTGKIHLQCENQDDIKIFPGQHCQLNKQSKKYSIREVDPDKYIGWKDGKLIFDDNSFENIAKRLSRWYNVDIKILDPEIKELTYTGTFIEEPLFQILEMLEVVSPVQFHLKERHKKADGSFLKREITVKLKNK